MDYRSLYYLIPRNPSGILYYRFKHSGKRGSTRCRNRDEAHEFMRALIEGRTWDLGCSNSCRVDGAMALVLSPLGKHYSAAAPLCNLTVQLRH